MVISITLSELDVELCEVEVKLEDDNDDDNDRKPINEPILENIYIYIHADVEIT